MERCTTMVLDARDMERAVDDPKLNRLIRDGWTVISSVTVDIGTEDRPRPSLLLVLAPPEPRGLGSLETGWGRVLAAGIWLGGVGVFAHALMTLVGLLAR